MNTATIILFLGASVVTTFAQEEEQEGGGGLVPMEQIVEKSRKKIMDPSAYPCVGANDCCSSHDKCGLGEGDCDPGKDECMDGLVCSVNECADYLDLLTERVSPMDLKFSGTDDCCVLPKSRMAEYDDFMYGKGGTTTTIIQVGGQQYGKK